MSVAMSRLYVFLCLPSKFICEFVCLCNSQKVCSQFKLIPMMVMCGAGLVKWTNQLSLSKSCSRCTVMLNVTVSYVAFVFHVFFLAGIPLQRAQQGHYGLGSLITHRDMWIQVVRQLPSQSNPVILFLIVPTLNCSGLGPMFSKKH